LVDDQSKKDLRERILTLLRSQKEEERFAKSLSIKDKLFQMKDIQKAETILFYASFDGEVDTAEMIKQARQLGKRIALPRTVPSNKEIIPTLWDAHNPLMEGNYGIKEPREESQRLDIGELDAVVVPGLAFDESNHRLGRGGGYYDRFLAGLPKDIPSFGLAFDFQRVNRIPDRLEHDIAVTYVVTN
jgi:5-formyltetrahydrofolate cyclo-ligase